MTLDPFANRPRVKTNKQATKDENMPGAEDDMLLSAHVQPQTMSSSKGLLCL
jgi:hypothetical protein